MAEITNWENRVKRNGTAIAKFYASWIKFHESQKLKLLTKSDDVSDYNLPVVRKSKKQKLDQQDIDESEEESEFEFRIKETNGETKKLPTSKPSKRKKKKMKISENENTESDIKDEDLPTENTDIVQDINSDDWD